MKNLMDFKLTIWRYIEGEQIEGEQIEIEQIEGEQHV